MAAFTEEELRLAEPHTEVKSQTLEAWYMDDSNEDQRAAHRQTPNKPCTLEELRKLGVLAWHLDADKHETDPMLAAIRKVRNYSYTEIITISKDKLPGYEAKIKTFFEEHIHDDEEIRFILDGTGYFDVRDLDDRWVRIKVGKGDMLVLPAGIYHRFTLDENDYIVAMRLFVGAPVWTPFNRPQDSHPAREQYLKTFASYVPAAV